MSVTQNQPTGDVKAALDFAAANLYPTVSSIAAPDGRAVPVAMLPTGHKLESVRKLLAEGAPNPERKTGIAILQDADSFIAHVNRFKDAQSAIFATDPAPGKDGRPSQPPKLTAIYDYHEAGTGPARYGVHRAVYECPVSPEWEAWLESDGEGMGQGDFAAFLEDRALDLLPVPLDPVKDERLLTIAEQIGGVYASPAKLQELARGLKVHESSTLKNAITLASGEMQMQYETSHQDQDGKPLKVPSLFLIGVPVFRRGAIWRIPVRLRYRTNGGRLTWIYQLYRPDIVMEDTIRELVERVARETELPVFRGHAEPSISPA